MNKEIRLKCPLSFTELKRRYHEHMAGPKDSLRAKLIEAVAEHEGWEEGAVSMIDEVIMPVLEAIKLPDKRIREALEKAINHIDKYPHYKRDVYWNPEALVIYEEAKQALDKKEV